jgi:ATP-dependent Clp protease ATP-binding subunit ClpA
MTPPPSLQDLIDTVRHDAGTDDSLGLLVTAAATAARLEDTTDALLGHFVDRCRADGRSWSEISAALGVTKQAVHKRFATAVAAHLIAAIPAPTLERFTDRARHVVAAATEEAGNMGEQAVGSEHILLGLFAEPAGLAGRALTAMNVSQEQVRAALTTARGLGAGAATTSAKSTRLSAPKFAEDGKSALRDALAVALELGHNYIGTEHLLLGLYRDEDTLAARILAEAGASESAARAHIMEMLRGFTASA